MNFLESQKSFALRGSKGNLVEYLKDTFKYSFWLNWFYFFESDDGKMGLSNRGMIETIILIEIDEKKQKLTLRTHTRKNYFFLLFCIVFFVTMIWLPGTFELETDGVLFMIGFAVFVLVVLLAIDRFYYMNKIISILKEAEFIA